MLILRYLYDHPHLLGTSFLRQTRPFRGSLRELVATLGVQGREDARNLTSLRARRRFPGDLEQTPRTSAPQIFLWLRSAKPQDGPRSQKKMWRCVMVSEPEKVSGKVPEDSLGSLSSCLVDGDAEQRTRERRVRRRALTISIILQSAVLTALILVPLFGKAERITFTIVTPIPPYSPYRGPARNPAQPPHQRTTQNQCHFCVPHNIPPTIVMRDSSSSATQVDDNPPEGIGQGIP